MKYSLVPGDSGVLVIRNPKRWYGTLKISYPTITTIIPLFSLKSVAYLSRYPTAKVAIHLKKVSFKTFFLNKRVIKK